MDNSIEDNKKSNIELNQKKCIVAFIKGCIIINQKGGLNIFQARDIADAIDIFTIQNETFTEEEQFNAIQLFINTIHMGQSKGLFEFDEARILANAIEIFYDPLLLSEDYSTNKTTKNISFD